jgi:hypothetical protein
MLGGAAPAAPSPATIETSSTVTEALARMNTPIELSPGCSAVGASMSSESKLASKNTSPSIVNAGTPASPRIFGRGLAAE